MHMVHAHPRPPPPTSNFAAAFLDGKKASHEKQRKTDQLRLQAVLAGRGDGSTLRGWRRELDPDGLLEVDYGDYIQTCARLNFMGDTSLLFGGDGDNSTLSLGELAPFEAQLVDTFRVWADSKFHGHKGVFSQLDIAGSGEISRETWCQEVAKAGFDGSDADIETLYHFCDVANKGCINQEQLIWLEMDTDARSRELHKAKLCQLAAWKQGAAQEYMEFKQTEQERKNSKYNTGMSPSHRLAPRPWMDRTFELMPTVVCKMQAQRLHDGIRNARHARIAFLKHLKDRYGSEIRAMRRELAPEGYHFSLMTLRNYIRRRDVKINYRDLWVALNRDNDGIISIEKLDPQGATILASFQKWAVKNPMLGSCASIWDSPEAANCSRRFSGTWFSEKKMLRKVFEETLRALEWSGIEDAEQRGVLFTALDFMNCGVYTRCDLEWLDKWRPLEWVYAKPDPAAFVKVKNMLVEKYGHPLKAWRCLLDRDDSNTIDWIEFKNACEKIHYSENVAGAWRALDTELTGRITMRHFDPPSEQLLFSFKEFCEANFGSVKLCFKGIDNDNSHAVTLSELKRTCNKLHWIGGDVTLLFNCLDVDSTKQILGGPGSSAKRVLDYGEIKFLDSWQIEPTEAEMQAEDDAMNPPLRKTQAHADALDSTIARLSVTAPTLEQLSQLGCGPPPLVKSASQPAGMYASFEASMSKDDELPTHVRDLPRLCESPMMFESSARHSIRMRRAIAVYGRPSSAPHAALKAIGLPAKAATTTPSALVNTCIDVERDRSPHVTKQVKFHNRRPNAQPRKLGRWFSDVSF